MCGSYEIALHTVLQSAVDDDILLLQVRVRYVDNARITVAYTSIYSSKANNIECYYICQRTVTRVLRSHSVLQW